MTEIIFMIVYHYHASAGSSHIHMKIIERQTTEHYSVFGSELDL